MLSASINLVSCELLGPATFESLFAVNGSEEVSRLVSDPDVLCGPIGLRHALAGIGFLYVAIGYALVLAVIFFGKDQVRSDPGCRYRFGSIVVPYRRGFEHWEAVEMGMVLVLSIGVALLSKEGAWAQLLYAVFVLACILVAYMYYRPLVRHWEGVYQFLVILQVLFFAIIALAIVGKTSNKMPVIVYTAGVELHTAVDFVASYGVYLMAML